MAARPPECETYRYALFHCRRGQMDARTRIQGNKVGAVCMWHNPCSPGMVGRKGGDAVVLGMLCDAHAHALSAPCRCGAVHRACNDRLCERGSAQSD